MAKQTTNAASKRPDDEAKVSGELVTGSNGKTRKPRQGDASLVECVMCSTEDHPVYCEAYSSKAFYTFYRCNVCGHHPPKRPNYARLQRRGKRQPPPNYDARA